MQGDPGDEEEGGGMYAHHAEASLLLRPQKSDRNGDAVKEEPAKWASG